MTSAATIGASHGSPTFAVIACIACMIPCSPDTCSLGNREQDAQRPGEVEDRDHARRP